MTYMETAPRCAYVRPPGDFPRMVDRQCWNRVATATVDGMCHAHTQGPKSSKRHVAAELAALRARVARLREALERVAGFNCTSTLPGPCGECPACIACRALEAGHD